MMTARSYLFLLVSALLVTLFCVVATNLVIDPYDIFHTPRIGGINAVKYSFNHRLTKAYKVKEKRYDGLIVGNSRGLWFDPDHAVWRGAPAYNMSIPGAKVLQILRYLQHAHGINRVSRALVGIDLDSFITYPGEGLDEDVHRFKLDVDGRDNPSYAPFLDYRNALMTNDALEKSRLTLYYNLKAMPPYHIDNGMAVPARRNAAVAAIGGHRNYFVDVEREYFDEDSIFYAMRTREPKTKNGPAPAIDESLAHFRTLLAFAHRNGIELHLYISPVHARFQAGIHHIGLWDLFGEWKQIVKAINREVAFKEHEEAFELWDFATVNPYTTEEVPPRRDKTTNMAWYWESSHFKTALADLVQEVAMDGADKKHLLNRSFGVLLNDVDVPAHHREQTHHLLEYLRLHPDDDAELQRYRIGPRPTYGKPGGARVSGAALSLGR